MLPYPLFFRFNICSEVPQRLSGESWSDCDGVEAQAVMFAAYFAVVLMLAAAACLSEDNRNTDQAMAAMMRVTVAADIIIAFCLVADSCVTLISGICRQFPLVRWGLLGSLTLSLNLWLAQTCLYFRNWMVAVIALARYRMFRQRQKLQWRSFVTTAGLLAANSAVFSLPQFFYSVGEVCSNDPFGPLIVQPLLIGSNVSSTFDIVNASVIVPLQAVLPFLLGFAASIAVMRILWQHMRPQQQQQQQQQGLTNQHRNRYWRPFIAFLVMNGMLLLLYLPVMLIRILSLMQFDINRYFWLSNVLCNAISLANIGVYFYLCKTCRCNWSREPEAVNNGIRQQGETAQRQPCSSAAHGAVGTRQNV